MRSPSPALIRVPAGDSFINLREFRQALEFMGIYLTGTEFRKLWRQFDTSGDGKINYSEFNNKVSSGGTLAARCRRALMCERAPAVSAGAFMSPASCPAHAGPLPLGVPLPRSHPSPHPAPHHPFALAPRWAT